MCSTRKSAASVRIALAVSAGIAASLLGCAKAPPPAGPEPASTATLPVDEAMQRRNWDRSYAEFESGAVIAGATRFPYVPQTTGEGASRAALGTERSNALLDNVYFITQSVALPFTYFYDKPFVKKEYRGVIYEPTHFAMPLLPPDEEPDYGAYAPPPLKDEEDVRAMEREGAPRDPSAPPRLRDQIRPEPEEMESPTITPEAAQPPVITREGSEPAPGEPGEAVKTEPETTPQPETTEPAPQPETTEPAPQPETTEPAPQPETAPQPESTEPAPEAAPGTAAEPAPEAAPESPEPAPAADENK